MGTLMIINIIIIVLCMIILGFVMNCSEDTVKRHSGWMLIVFAVTVLCLSLTSLHIMDGIYIVHVAL